MNHKRTALAFFVTAALCVLPSAARGQQPTVVADAFVDSVGVNIHLHYFDTAYVQFSLIRSRLIELGVRHVRDGLTDTTWQDYYRHFDSLAEAGIKATFIVAPNQSTELWASYPARMPRSFEAYEAPNEWNKSGDPNWAQTLRQTMVRLRSLRNDSRSAAFPVIGPSLSKLEAYSALGDVSAYFDSANLHNYLGGRYPGTTGWGYDGYGSIAWSVRNIRPYAGGKPIIATENGYPDNGATVDAVPQDVAGRYMPRLLMEQYRQGIMRTYIYELADWSASGNYGILNHDLSPKPAFRSVKSLLNLLSDPGPAFTPQNLGYSVQGGTNEVRHMVFQKRDGTYFLAVWVEAASWNNAGERVTVPPQSVTVTTTLPWRVTRKHRWQLDGSSSPSTALALLPTKTIPLDISDKLTVIELAPPLLGGLLPGVPLGLAASAADRNVHLRWQAPADGGAPTSFTIEASTSLSLANPVSVPVGATTELTVPNVPPGVYFVRVRAANANGQGAPSAIIQFAVGVPEPPQLVPLQVSTNPIALSWSPGAGASQYVLSAGTSPGSSDVAVVPMGTATQVTAPVPAGVRYYVRVAAVNAHGSTRSNEVSFAVGGARHPGAPTLQAHVNGRRVTLSWTPGAGGALDNYVLAVGTSPGAANLGVFPVGRTTQITGDSPIAGTLFVRVYAQNSIGATASNEVSLSVP